MKRFKKVLLIVFILFIIFIGALIAIPYFYKEELTVKAKEIINENVEAEVAFGDVKLNMLSHFPNLTFSVADFTINGKDEFEDVRLASAKKAEITLVLSSALINSDVKIKNIELEQPDIHILVLSDGKTNYDIAKPSSAESKEGTSSGDYQLELQSYSIKDGKLIYDDEQTHTFLVAEGINHKGSGNFTKNIYDLNTKTEIAALSVDYEGISYLNKADTKLDAIFNINQESQTYTLKDNTLTVNALQLHGAGAVQMKEEAIALDLSLSAPENSFKNLLSMVPGAYLEAYEDVKANGNFQFNGNIKGTYSVAKKLMPAFNFDLKVNDADVKYPDLSLGISNIRAVANVKNPGSHLDQMVLNVSDFNVKIGTNPIAGRFKLSRPISDPTIDTKVDGALDLAELAQAFPIQDLEEMKGQISAHIEAKASLAQMERGDYSNMEMAGQVNAKDIVYKSSAYPAIEVKMMDANLAPQSVDIPNFVGQLGESDLSGSAKIENILAYFSPKSTMKGAVVLNSNFFFVDEWMPEASSEEEEPSAGQLDTLQAANAEMFDRYDFRIEADAKEIVYDQYKLLNSAAKGRFSPDRLILNSASTNIEDSDFKASGRLYNIMDYVFKDEVLTGSLAVNSKKVNLNPFMVSPTSDSDEGGHDVDEEAKEGYGTILVPKNIDISVKALVDELIYTNMTIKDLKGNLKIEDESVALRQVKGETLGGEVGFTGIYDTQDAENPYYGMKLNLDGLGFQNAFNTFNTFQALAPIGKFLDGVLTSTLNLKGKLGEGMIPDINTLDAVGFLETTEASLFKYPPLVKIGEKLRINEFKEAIKIKNSKNWVEIKNGIVDVKPFDIKVDDIAMTIAGKHGINQPMDYNINAAIPRKKLGDGFLGAGLQGIQNEASKLGINLNQVENINVLIHLTGTLMDPKLEFKFVGADGKSAIGEIAEGILKEQVQEKYGTNLEEEAEKLEDKANETTDTLAAKANEELDKLKEKAGSKVDTILKKQGLDTLLNKESQKVLDTLLKKAEVDDIKKELEKFNPFKKKKKKNDQGNG